MKWNLVTFADDKFLNRQKYLEEYAKSLDIGTKWEHTRQTEPLTRSHAMFAYRTTLRMDSAR